MSKNIEALAKDIYEWCYKSGMWDFNIIYFDGKAWANFEEWGEDKGRKIGESLYEYENKNPLEYFEYANPDTLSMSFEGSMYHLVNYYFEDRFLSKLKGRFDKLFEKHGYYYEQGHAWNLSVYEL